jgi:general secretion pathway protein G
MFYSATIVPPRMQPQSPLRPLRRLSRSAVRAFTMLELIVVIGILAMLATLAISNLGTFFGDAQHSTTSLFVKESMSAPLMQYRMHMGDYPSTAEGLQALATPPANKASSWRGPYVKDGKIPLDPWKQPYEYRYPGVKNKTSYDIWSKGLDQISDTADDIGNWDVAPATPAK